MRRELLRLAAGLGLAYLALGLWTGVWGLWRGRALLARADNPRRYIAEGRVHRGAIYDRDLNPLAISDDEGGLHTRHWLVPEAALVTGYSSVLYGRTGIEAAMDPVLSGEIGRAPLEAWWEDLAVGAPVHGQDVQLTLSAELQKAAVSALGSRAGAVVLIEIGSGDILVLASNPGYDPNRLEEDWEALSADSTAPLLNRAALGLYQPGASVFPFVLSAGLQNGLASLDQPVRDPGAEIRVDGHLAGCTQALTLFGNSTVTLADAFRFACPAPFANLGEDLPAGQLIQSFDDFGLYGSPEITIPTASSPRPDLPPPGNTALEAIGQGTTTVSPLQMALAVAGIGNRGVIPAPRLVAATQLPSGEWLPYSSGGHPKAATSPETAETIRAAMSRFGQTPLGATAGLNSFSAGGFASAPISSPEGKSHAWFLGFVPSVAPEYAIAVLIESPEPLNASRIGAKLLQAALQSE